MLTIMKNRWYARPMIAGKRVLISLAVPVEGTRPASLRRQGDAAFEVSRAAALRAAEAKMSQVHDARWHARMAVMLTPEPKRKKKTPTVEMAGLFEAWRKAPHSRPRCDRYEQVVRTVLGRLESWAKTKGLRAVSDFETTHAIAWKEWLMGQGYTGRNLNQHLIIARSVFRHVRFVAGIQGNPFDGVTGVQEATVHRAPLSEEQVTAAIAKAPEHARGVMVCGACTAMRLGDCCRLTWGSVDLDAGFITVKTHKSGARVEIPILPDLAVELKKAGGSGAEDAFVWPEMAEFYRKSPGLVSALFMRAFERAEISTTVKRESKRAANVAGFHALRTTWITRALSAGVPTELVRRVSGHSGVEVVLKHYFQPGRAELKDAILKAFNPPPMKKKGKGKKAK